MLIKINTMKIQNIKNTQHPGFKQWTKQWSPYSQEAYIVTRQYIHQINQYRDNNKKWIMKKNKEQ